MRGTLRTPFVVALVVLVAGGAATSSVGASGDAVAQCRSKQLLVVSSEAGAAAGTSYQALIFINKGSRCSMTGYPGVSAVRYGAAAPVRVGPPAKRESPFSFAARAVVLDRNGTSSSVLSQVNARNFPASSCHLAKADALRIYPPNERTSIIINLPTEVCRRFATLGVGPVEPGVPHALQRSG